MKNIDPLEDDSDFEPVEPADWKLPQETIEALYELGEIVRSIRKKLANPDS